MSSRLFQWFLPQLFLCLNLGGVVTYAVTASSLQATLQLSTSQIGSLGGAYFMAYALSQLLLGCSLGAIPPRLLLGLTAMIAAAGAFLLSQANSFALVMLARVLMGIGFGTAMVGVVHVVGQLFRDRYPLMVNLSQSLANGVGAMLGVLAPIPLLQNFRQPFQIIGVLLLIVSILLLLFSKDLSQSSAMLSTTDQQQAPQNAHAASLVSQLSAIFSNGQFWLSTIYFTGLFASFLAYADLWNIKFQTDVFGYSNSVAPMINSGVAFGLMIGGIVTGILAGKVGFLLPARLCSWSALLLMGLLYTEPLHALATVLMALLGFCMGAAPLGLAAMNAHIPERLQGLATPILLTLVFLGGGLLMANVGTSLASLPPHAFSTYREGLNWFLVPIAMASVSSLLIRPGRADAAADGP